MNKLYILTGLPYSGKTTLRRKLVERLKLDYVSVDEIMKDKDMWRDGHPTQEDWDEAYSEAYEQIKNLLKKQKSVIFDNANLTFEEREVAKQISQVFGAVPILIYIKTPIDKIMKRRKENEIIKLRGHLEDHLLKSAIDKFEEPREKENPIIYNSRDNIKEWIERNF